VVRHSPREAVLPVRTRRSAASLSEGEQQKEPANHAAPDDQGDRAREREEDDYASEAARDVDDRLQPQLRRGGVPARGRDRNERDAR